MSVLVVGGGGLVGGAILKALAEFAPVSAGRRPGPLVLDATDGAAVARAVRGMAAVVNAMAGPPEAMIAATAHLAQAAARAGIPLIQVSSMAVYGNATGLIGEDHKLAATSRYGAAKISCERLAAGPANVILRPGIVYGPGSEPWTGRMARLLRAGRLGDLGAAGDGRCNLIYADDVGAAVAAALRRPASGAFNLATPDPPRWNAWLTRLACAIGAVPVARLGARRLALEARVLAPALQIAKIAAARAGWQRSPDPISPSLLALFGQDITLDHRYADAVLGFVRTSDAAGLAAAAAWARW